MTIYFLSILSSWKLNNNNSTASYTHLLEFAISYIYIPETMNKNTKKSQATCELRFGIILRGNTLAKLEYNDWNQLAR